MPSIIFLRFEKIHLNKNKKQSYFWLKSRYSNAPLLLLKKTSPYEYTIVNDFSTYKYSDDTYIQLIDSLANGYKILTIRDEKDNSYETTSDGKRCKHIQFWEWDIVEKHYKFVRREPNDCQE